MKLLINTATTYKGGGVQVARSFLTECKAYPQNQYHVVIGEGLSALIDKNDFPDNFYFYKIDYRPATKVFSFSDQAKPFKEIEKKIEPDVVFTTSGPAYWRPKAPHLMGFNLPHHLYPESPYFKIIPLVSRIKWKLKKQAIHFFAKRDADAYVVQTDDVGKRLQKFLNKNKIFTVTNSCGSYYDNPENSFEKKLPPKKNNDFRLLFLSAYYNHKHFEIINEIAKIKPNNKDYTFTFITTLPSDIFEQVFTQDAKNIVKNIGPVKPNESPGLYLESDFVFLPTLLECFSATYVEGMKMKKPILTTNLSFAHTVCGDAALYFEPLNAHDALNKICFLIENTDLQLELINKGKQKLHEFLTAKQRAQRYLAICEELFLTNNQN